METLSMGFTLDQAIKIAQQAHEGQTDKAGKPYIEHPIFVMNLLQTDEEKMTGVLHDVVEDRHITFDDLEKLGCPASVIVALRLVTHPEDFDGTEEAYMEGIGKIVSSGNQVAINVKYADLTHNSDLTRIPNPTEKDFARVAKYKKSLDILKPLASDYLIKHD